MFFENFLYLMKMKLGEFLALNQGTKIVNQYLHTFNNLCRYAPDMVDTDAKRIISFKRELNPKMIKRVGINTRNRFNDFISDCLKQEKNKIAQKDHAYDHTLPLRQEPTNCCSSQDKS
jgi:hypothetical protein